MTAQGQRQDSVRAVTGTELDYGGDWSALFNLDAIPAGDWNGRLLNWLNARMETAYTSLPQAQAAFATANNATTWSAMGTFDAELPA